MGKFRKEQSLQLLAKAIRRMSLKFPFPHDSDIESLLFLICKKTTPKLDEKLSLLCSEYLVSNNLDINAFIPQIYSRPGIGLFFGRIYLLHVKRSLEGVPWWKSPVLEVVDLFVREKLRTANSCLSGHQLDNNFGYKPNISSYSFMCSKKLGETVMKALYGLKESMLPDEALLKLCVLAALISFQEIESCIERNESLPQRNWSIDRCQISITWNLRFNLFYRTKEILICL